MDVATVDQEYQQLQQESATLTQALQDFAGKLQAAGTAGNTAANEWVLDLKGIALQIQQEQLQVQALLLALHDFVANTLQPAPQVPATQSAPVQTVPQQPVPVQAAGFQGQSGGLLSRFRGGGFGQAVTQGLGMGAGFGLADSMINSIFGN